MSQHFQRLLSGDCSDEWPHFLFAGEMDQRVFNGVLRSFLNGVSFVLDITSIPRGMEISLERFILENSLHVEEVNYFTKVRRVVLGTAEIFLLRGGDLLHLSSDARDCFWKKTLSLFNFSFQGAKVDAGVVTLWKKRLPRQGELSFAEIRRGIFYNPTDYSRKVVVHPQKEFRFLGYEGDPHVGVKPLDGGVVLSLPKDGYMNLDFGLVE